MQTKHRPMSARDLFNLARSAYRAGLLWGLKSPAYRARAEAMMRRAVAVCPEDYWRLATRCSNRRAAPMTIRAWAAQRGSRWARVFRTY